MDTAPASGNASHLAGLSVQPLQGQTGNGFGAGDRSALCTSSGGEPGVPVYAGRGLRQVFRFKESG